MKLKTAVISIVVSVALVGSAGYGAYYAMQGSKSPVEVVPVSNVNTGYWGMSESIYGTVTSQVAQTVQLNEEYSIDKIYVKEGDQVKEGDPLFSYDMTLQELELEMEQLSLQTQELTMTKLEKDLEKLKNTRATASLEDNDSTMTASSQEELVIEEIQEGPQEGTGEAGTEENSQDRTGSSEKPEGNSQSETGTPENAEGSDTPSGNGTGDSEDSEKSNNEELQVEGIEEMPLSGDTEEQLAIVDCVVSYERLVTVIDSLFQAYGEELCADEIGSAIEEAVQYYRRHLADEKITTEGTGEDLVQIRSYVIKDSVQAALGEEETEKLKAFHEKLDEYQTCYVMMLIDETWESSPANMGGLNEQLEKIHASYDLLDTKQQEAVENYDKISELELMAQKGSSEESLEDSNAGQIEEGESLEGSERGQAETGQYGAAADPTGGEQTESNGPDQEKLYKVYVVEGTDSSTDNSNALVYEYPAGKTVELDAEDKEEQKFKKWELSSNQVTLEFKESNDYHLAFTMPEGDVTVKKVYDSAPGVIQGYVENFSGLYEKAVQSQGLEKKEYATLLGDAVAFYQQWLAESSVDILDETVPWTMDQYTLKEDVRDYLSSNGGDAAISQLEGQYQELCIKYARALFDCLNADALVREDLEKAVSVYKALSDPWRSELEAQWTKEQSENGETAEDTQNESEESGNGNMASSIGDLLAAYQVFLLFQEYQGMAPSETEEARIAKLQEVYKAYLALTEEQKWIVAQNQTLVDTLQQFGLWQDPNYETEPGTEDLGGYGDFGDFGDGEAGYTASELKEMIEEKERDIKECSLEIREIELSVKQKQRIVDGKVIKSTLDGTVVSIGTAEGESDDEYFAKVTNETGLYVKGNMNELALEKIHVGDTISGMMSDTGVTFTAVIKEISDYPDADGGSMGFGTENTNASYYPFYAEIEDSQDVNEGEAEIQLSAAMSSDADGIYLEKYFVRTESDGRPYVYIEDGSGKLKKQYVETGKLVYSYAIEIVSGLEPTDKIAFPYGKKVKEGAETKEVDILQDAYM